MVDRRTVENSSKLDQNNSSSFWNLGTKTHALAVWTITDQRKLVSLNSLYERVMEFHRNVHTKESPLMLVSPTNSPFNVLSADGVNPHTNFDSNAASLANVITFSNDKSKRLMQPMNYTQLHAFCQGIIKQNPSAAPTSSHLAAHVRNPAEEKERESSLYSAPSILADINQPPNSSITENRDYYWIHLKDLNSLEIFHSLFKMHDLIYAGFYDLRAHSTMIPTDSELLMSNVICALEDSSFRMYKIYIYIRDNVLITYEVELFPNLEECDDPNAITQSMLRFVDRGTTSPVNTVTSPLPSVDIAAHSNVTTDTNASHRTISSASPFVSTITDRIMTLFFKYSTKLKKKVLELGVTYLVYEISQQILTFYDGTIEFIASSLSYFNRVVQLNLLHRERMAMMVKIHMILAGISFIRKAVEGCVENYAKLAHIESAVIEDYSGFNMMSDIVDDGSLAFGGGGGGGSSHPPHARKTPSERTAAFQSTIRMSKIPFLREEHALYLYDLHDSYIFKRSCLQRQAEEIRRLESELDATIQLRTTNTNTLLSLTATTFLPLTFFAGVFGMNFTENGGYSIDLLNVDYGPNVFIGLCLGSFLLSILFFSYQGWLEFGIFARFYRTVNDGYSKIDDTKNVSNFTEGAIRRAEQEETRRKEDSMYMRTSYNHFSTRGSASGRSFSSLSGIQTVYPNQALSSKQTIQQIAAAKANSVPNELERDSTALNITVKSAED